MTQVDAARHLGFGSSTVLKKVGREALQAKPWLVPVPTALLDMFSPPRCLVLIGVPALPPALSQVMRRLGIKQWPYRKRTSAKKITHSLEVRLRSGPVIELLRLPGILGLSRQPSPVQAISLPLIHPLDPPHIHPTPICPCHPTHCRSTCNSMCTPHVLRSPTLLACA